MVKHSKRYAAVAEKVDPEALYQPDDAINLVKELSTAKFDETVEIHLRTGADPRHADQMVRGVAGLPHGLGKTVRVLVFADSEAAEIAREAKAPSDQMRALEGLRQLLGYDAPPAAANINHRHIFSTMSDADLVAERARLEPHVIDVTPEAGAVNGKALPKGAPPSAREDEAPPV